MNKFPYPDQKPKDKKEVELHFAELVSNALEHLNIGGYTWNILLPDEDGFSEDKDAGASITVEYPYKRFAISIQQNTIDRALKAELDSGFWPNAERSMFHECFHILTWRISVLSEKRYVTQREINDADEELVDHLAIVFLESVKDWRKEKNAKVKAPPKRKRVKTR